MLVVSLNWSEAALQSLFSTPLPCTGKSSCADAWWTTWATAKPRGNSSFSPSVAERTALQKGQGCQGVAGRQQKVRLAPEFYVGAQSRGVNIEGKQLGWICFCSGWMFKGFGKDNTIS